MSCRVVLADSTDLCALCGEPHRRGQVVLDASGHHLACTTAHWLIRRAFPKEPTRI